MFPAWNMLHLIQCRCLSFSSADSYTLDTTPECSESSEDEEADFQTVPLDDEHWISKETLERTLCIHEHGLPHGLCPVFSTNPSYLTIPSVSNDLLYAPRSSGAQECSFSSLLDSLSPALNLGCLSL